VDFYYVIAPKDWRSTIQPTEINNTFIPGVILLFCHFKWWWQPTETDPFVLEFWDEEWLEDFKQHACKCFIGNCQLLPFKLWKYNILMSLIVFWTMNSKIVSEKIINSAMGSLFFLFIIFFKCNFFKNYFRNSFKEKSVAEWDMDACKDVWCKCLNLWCMFNYLMHI